MNEVFKRLNDHFNDSFVKIVPLYKFIKIHNG